MRFVFLFFCSASGSDLISLIRVPSIIIIIIILLDSSFSLQHLSLAS